MAESIDQLQIDINAQANRANKVIDTLCSKIDRLTVSMNRLDGSKLGVLANGVQRLGTAMHTMNNVKTSDFTRLAKNLQTLNNLDVSKLSNLSVNVKHIATVFNGLIGMEESAKQMTALASGIKQLGYSSAEKAITNIPLLATAMKKLMSELSTAPKVSQNLIDMTNALAKLARTGSSSGKAANSLVSSFNRISKASSGMKINLLSAVNGISAIRKSILQAIGIAGGFYAVFQGIKESINIASDLTEVQNVVDVTFGDFKSKMEDLANVSITELGMSKLTAKEIGSRFQAMGTAIGFTQGKMADMSVELTRLAGDMSSFYNVEQKDVAKSLQSIFTGETEPMRKYGVDLTNATLKEWALKKGMDANISTMSQMQKTALRYQYVLEATGAAQGDFLRTQDTWANQVRILKENFRELASVIGSSFIHALKPLVKALNSAMSAIISFAKVVSNALGKIFGWQYEDATGGIVNDYEDAADAAGDLADGTGKAADNAKKLKQQLQGIDELNVLASDTDTGTSGGSVGGGSSGGSEDSSVGKWTKTDSILKDFESDLDTLYKLGEYIGETLTDAMKSIDWNNIYQGAKNFGSGLASFLNGLISPELFGEVGKTIAASLNTALYALNSFGTDFDWKDFGNSVASGINNFFSTFDFRNLADTINTWVDGIKTTIVTTIKNIKWSDVIKGAFEFFDELELDTIMIALGAFAWKYKGKEIALSSLNTLLSTEIATGIGSINVSLGASIGLSITTAVVGFKIGNWLYDNVDSIQSISDAIAEWITKDGDEIAIARTIGITLSGLTVSIGTAEIITCIATALTEGAAVTSLKMIGTKMLAHICGGLATVSEVGSAIATGASAVWSALGSALSSATTALSTLGSTIVSGIGTALSSIGSFLTSSVSTVFAGGAASIAAGLFAAIGAAIGGWNIGQLIYDKFSEQIDSIVTKVGDFFTKTIPQALSSAGKAVVDFAINIKANIDDIKQKVIEKFNNAKEWIADKAIEVKSKVGDIVEKVKDAFNQATSWLKENFLPLKIVTNPPKWEDIKEKIISIRDNVADTLKTKFGITIPSWNDIKGKVGDIYEKVRDKLKVSLGINIPSWNSLSKKIRGIAKKIADKLKATLKIKLPHISVSISKTAGKTLTDKLYNKLFGGKPGFKVNYYAAGGFPEDGWFRASHGEMIGKFDNGQSVVANNKQITEGISSAVQRGNQQMISYMQQEIAELRTQNQLLTELLNKEVGISYSDVGKASQKYAREYTNRTGKPAYI